jgi:hypothetical protein
MRIRLGDSFFCIILFCIPFLRSVEYIYPIASFDDGKTLLLMDQISPLQRALILWDVETKQSTQALWSLFNPAHVQLLPDKSGFSFLDNGRLRIQKFQKRSPKAIDFDKPLYNIGMINWIDMNFCYCSAQSGDNFALFQLCTDGTLCCIASHPHKDYLYPQKSSSHLFYIERERGDMHKKDAHYAIMHMPYPVIDHDYGDDKDYETTDYALSAVLVMDFHDIPIVFLNMRSETEGFVLAHDKNIVDKDTLLFCYYCFAKIDDEWRAQKLFSFKIPLSLLTSDEDRLYESLLPLLPKVVDSTIYFVDCSHNKHSYLELYSYAVSTKTIKKIATQSKHHSFVPVQCGTYFFIGGKNVKKRGIIDIPRFLT